MTGVSQGKCVSLLGVPRAGERPGGLTPPSMSLGANHKAQSRGASWSKSGIELPHSDRLPHRIGHLALRTALCASAVALLALLALPGYGAAGPDPAACAVLLAKRVSDPEHLGDLLRAAETLWPERPAEAAGILSHAHGVAKKPGRLEPVARLYVKFGQKAKAVELAAQLIRDGAKEFVKEFWSPRFCAELGEIGLALELVKTAERQDPWACPRLVYVASEYLAAGQKGRALDLLAQVEEEAKRVAQGDHWHAGPCEAAAEGYAAAGEFDRALAVAERIPETLHHMAYEGEERFSPVRYKIAALVKIALRCAEAGQGKRSLETLALARRIAQAIRHRYLRAEMLKEVAIAYAGAEPYGTVYRQRRDEGHPPLDPALATETARAIDHPLVKARALHDVAAKLLKAGNRELFLTAQSEAVQTALAIEDASPDASASELDFACDTKCGVLFHLAAAFAQAGEKQRAVDVLTRMAGAARGMHFPTERAETLAGLAERLAEAGETKPALQLAAEASELAKDEKVRSFHQYEARVLTAVGEAYFAAGDRDEAWKLFRRAIQVAREPVKEGNWACYTLNGTATRLAKAGRFDDALQLAAAIEQPYSRASAYREIAHLCVAAGRFEQALEAGREVREPAARVVLLAAISKRYPARGAEPSHRACGLLEELAR